MSYENENQNELNLDHWSSLEGHRLQSFEEAVEFYIKEHVYCKFPLSVDDLNDKLRFEILSKFSNAIDRNKISNDLTLQLISERLASLIITFVDECQESLYKFDSGAYILAHRKGALNNIISKVVYDSGSF
jgi:hypothetical protein